MRIQHFLYLILLIGSFNSLAAQEIIWGGVTHGSGGFIYGLNGWTASAVSPNEQALWQWDEDGIPSEGAYASSTDGIESESLWILSPQFSTKGYHNVYLTWTQYVRQYRSYFSVEITSDGGTTWDVVPIDVNNKLEEHEASARDMKVFLPVFEEMGDKDSVQFKFVYDADYYFWAIDDVTVVEGPAESLSLSNGLYPFDAAILDTEIIRNPDTAKFAIEVTNHGLEYQKNAIVSVSIRNQNNELLKEFSEIIPAIPSGETVLVTFVSVDVSIGDLYWDYFWDSKITYDIAIQDSIIFDTTDKSLSYTLKQESERYNLCSEITDFISFNSGDYSAAISFYSHPQQFQNTELGRVSIIPRNIEDNFIYNTNFKAYAFWLLNQDTLYSSNPLFTSTEFGLNDTHENLLLIASGETFVEELENNSSVNIQLKGEHGDIASLGPGTYVIAVNWETENEIELAISDKKLYPTARSFTHIVTDSTDNGWHALNNQIAWNIDLGLSYWTTNQNVEIEALDAGLYPNPALHSTTLDLKFNSSTTGIIQLTNSEGETIDEKVITDVIEESINYDVRSLAPGLYNFIISTSENKTSSISFIKI